MTPTAFWRTLWSHTHIHTRTHTQSPSGADFPCLVKQRHFICQWKSHPLISPVWCWCHQCETPVCFINLGNGRRAGQLKAVCFTDVWNWWLYFTDMEEFKVYCTFMLFLTSLSLSDTHTHHTYTRGRGQTKGQSRQLAETCMFLDSVEENWQRTTHRQRKNIQNIHMLHRKAPVELEPSRCEAT